MVKICQEFQSELLLTWVINSLEFRNTFFKLTNALQGIQFAAEYASTKLPLTERVTERFYLTAKDALRRPFRKRSNSLLIRQH